MTPTMHNARLREALRIRRDQPSAQDIRKLRLALLINFTVLAFIVSVVAIAWRAV